MKLNYSLESDGFIILTRMDHGCRDTISSPDDENATSLLLDAITVSEIDMLLNENLVKEPPLPEPETLEDVLGIQNDVSHIYTIKDLLIETLA